MPKQARKDQKARGELNQFSKDFANIKTKKKGPRKNIAPII